MKLDNLRDVFIEVYESDPMILISLFHLQAGETLKNLSEEVLGQLKQTSGKALTAITAIVTEGIEEGVFINDHPVALADCWLLHKARYSLSYGLSYKPGYWQR